MKTEEKYLLLGQIIWDYNINPEDIDATLSKKSMMAGHYTREMIFLKILESYSWFTILQMLTPLEIQNLLTSDLIQKLRSPSLRKKYEFVRQRLQEIIPTAR